MKKRHVLITGGAGGIGLALARRFIAAGDRVFLTDLDIGTLMLAQSELPQLQTEVLDVRDTQALKSFADVHGSDPAGPDTIINNAGIHISRLLTENNYPVDQRIADIDKEIQTNFTAVVQNCVIWQPYLARRGTNTTIVNVASALSFLPKYSSAVYCGCKAAVDHFSKVFRMQLKGSNIKLVTVYPPLINTAMTKGRASHASCMSAEEFASVFYRLLRSGKTIIRIGEVWWLYYLNRMAPGIAARFIEP